MRRKKDKSNGITALYERLSRAPAKRCCSRNPPARCADCPAPAGRAARRPVPAGQFPAGCGHDDNAERVTVSFIKSKCLKIML